MTDKTQTIRSLNDQFRNKLPSPSGVPGQVLLTHGIQAICNTGAEPNKYLPELFELVRTFDEFTVKNDPHKEHDFGAFDFQSERCFWKFGYYAPDLKWGSDDPADTTKTVRVLTIMLASEY